MIAGVLALGNWASQISAASSNDAAATPGTPLNALPVQNSIVARAVPVTEDTSTRSPAAAKLAEFSAGDMPKGAAAAPPVPQKPAPQLKTYVVQDGDNPYDLARQFNISEETLLAANGLAADSTIGIGQKLLIPPVSGIVVTTEPGATVSALANQFKISPTKLIAVNHLDPTVQALLAGEPLVLPDVAPPVQIYPDGSDQADAPSAAAQAAPRAASRAAPQAAPRPAPVAVAATAPVDKRPAVRISSGNNFPWGQCTYWAAQSRPDIGARVVGNAASWLYSARAAGLPTGTVPRPGAIVVYQPGAQGAAWTGHVAYVTSVSPNGVNFTVSEMNFPYWGVVTRRASWTGPGVAFIY